MVENGEKPAPGIARAPYHALPAVASAGMVAAAVMYAPRGIADRPGELGLWLAVAVLAALHRPFAGPAGLGLGALALAPIGLRIGAAAAALVGVVAMVAVAAFYRWLPRRHAAGQAASWPAAAERAAFVGGAALVAAAAASRLPWPAVLPAALYVAFLVAARWLAARLGGRPTTVEEMRPSILDAIGWPIGVLLAEVAETSGGTVALLLALALAGLAAEAARHAALRGASDHRVDDYQRLHGAHERILGEVSGMGEIAQQILVECRNVLPVHWFQLELEDGEGDGFSAGPDGRLFVGPPAPASRPPALPGVHRRASWRRLERSLEADGETLARVRLWCDPRRIEPGAEALFSSLVPQMASSVHRAQLDREARLDPLTGVPVRRQLDSRLQRSFQRACAEGGAVAVILCDIDHFKRVNDTWGHAAGDAALVAVAGALDGCRRDRDLLCRYGGEEFTLLLDNTEGPAALQLAERLRSAVAEIELEWEGTPIPLRLSLGIAAFPELHVKTATELLLLADEALYQAKERGRDCALLNLGRGRFHTARGETLADAPTEPVEAPRLFS